MSQSSTDLMYFPQAAHLYFTCSTLLRPTQLLIIIIIIIVVIIIIIIIASHSSVPS